MKSLLLSALVLTFSTPIFAATPQSYVYLRCNSTSWDLKDSNLLQAAGQGFSLTVTPTQSWMLDAGDSCVVTVTPKKGAWTTKTNEYILSLPKGEKAVESTSYQLVPSKKVGSATFRLKYSSLTPFTVFVDLKNKQFSLSKLYFHGMPVVQPEVKLPTELAETFWAQIGTSTFLELRVAQQTEFLSEPFLGLSLIERGLAEHTATVLDFKTGHILNFQRPLFETTWNLVSDFTPLSAGGQDEGYLTYLGHLLNETTSFELGEKQFPFEVQPNLLETVDFLQNLLNQQKAKATPN